MFNANALIDGWTHPVNTANFTCGQTGTYLFGYFVTCVPPSDGRDFGLRLVRNGAEIVGSQIARELLASGSERELGKTALSDVNTGDIIKVQMVGEVNNIQITPYYTGTIPVSASFDITRIK